MLVLGTIWAAFRTPSHDAKEGWGALGMVLAALTALIGILFVFGLTANF
jgi:hypothetical protein